MFIDTPEGWRGRAEEESFTGTLDALATRGAIVAHPPRRATYNRTMDVANARSARTGSTRSCLLGGHGTRAFLRRFWHKKALLVRGALPGFTGALTVRELASLAMRDDVESRLVIRDGARWSLAHGPFRRGDLRNLPNRDWTLLVQSVNLHSEAADALLRRFDFLPFARLDDLMASVAAPGGGVGPHFDSYDVFLLQGAGRRRWRYGRQRDLSLVPGLPVKILRRFKPRHDAVLGPGDMLYLPPSFAHDGIAVDACTTWSIGFRAPAANELATAFLDFLRDRVDLHGRYADPDLEPTREPARIGNAMRRRCAATLATIRWTRADTDRFLGTYLSEPKPSVTFERPSPPLTRAAFGARARRRGVRLDLRSQLLYDEHRLYLNGEVLAWPATGAPLLRRLANERSLAAAALAGAPAGVATFLYDGYCHGYLHAAD
jgi:50S ribosomal protein L16 3-hydroxylase